MDTKTILLTLTYLVGAGELILAIYFWATHSKSEIRKVIALLAFSTGIWVVLSAATSYISYSSFGYLLMALVYIFGLILITTLLYLILIMPFPLLKFDKIHKLLMYFPVLIFGFMLIYSKTIIESFTGSATLVGKIIGGPLYGLYNFYLVLIFLTSVVLAFARIKKLDGIHKRNMVILIWSVILGGTPAIILYLIFPIVAPSININDLIGVIPSFIWVGGVTYIALKK